MLPSTEAERLLVCHLHFRALNGASDRDPLFDMGIRRFDTVRREAATDLHIPACAPNQARSEGLADRWRHDLGVVLRPLGDQHLPTPEELSTRWLEEAA